MEDCGDVVNKDVTGNSPWAVPGGIGELAVVAMIGLDVMPMGKGVRLHGADKCAEWDIRDEFETIDGMPVYYGGDLCTSDESDWEDPYDIACAEYVEQYNFDAIEGMELRVFEPLKRPNNSVMMVRERTGSTPMRQTSSSHPRWESDTVGVEPVAHIFNAMHDVPDTTISQDRQSCSETRGDGTALYYEGDISDSDCVSVEDHERDIWEDWCESAFHDGYGAVPLVMDDPLPTVVFSDKLFSDEVPADRPVSDGEELTVSVLQVFTDEGAPLVHPVKDRIVRMDNNELALMNRRMGEALVLSVEIGAPLIHGNTLDAGISQGDTEWLYLLYSASLRSARDSKGLDHWKRVVWDPGIVGQYYLHVCCDCLCLMALFHEMMLFAHDWAVCSLWTGAVSRFCRTITWGN